METYHPTKHPEIHFIKKYRKQIILIIFLAVLFFLVFTTFSGKFSNTGNIIKGNIIPDNLIGGNIEGDIEFEAKLTIPELTIDGKFEKIELNGNSNSILYVGDQKFDLSKIGSNNLELNDFNGVISFSGRTITSLKGKILEVVVNGVLVAPIKESTKIRLDDSFNYKSLEIEKGVSISELTYETSGVIKLNNKKEVFNINNEEITINDFNGGILIIDNKFNAEGYIKKLSISGESNINIQS